MVSHYIALENWKKYFIETISNGIKQTQNGGWEVNNK